MQLVRIENIHEENRGWIVDRVAANIDSEMIGRLDIEYIPKSEWDVWYSSPSGYAIHIGGWCCSLNRQRKDPRDLSKKDFLALANYAWWNRKFPDLEERFDEYVTELEERIVQKMGKAIETFKEHHLDCPFEAYVTVDKKFRRQGIATQLYIEGSKWMKERGLFLRASTLLSKDAEALWDSFLERGLAVPHEKWKGVML